MKFIAKKIALLLFVAGLVSPVVASPSITITNLPRYGATSGSLAGVVTGADPAANDVAVFIYIAGGWYSKPNCASQLTPIRSDGTWSANIVSVGSDSGATEVAAFLVPTNYNLPCLNGAAGLTIPTQAIAVVYADRVKPAARKFNFSGYAWWVKTSSGSLAGPGPNYFSDSANNVWVDAQGALHLRITYTNNNWQCAEIISDRSFGYGQYRFTVQAPVDALDANAVLGMFTYSDESAYNDREIDIELSRWNYNFGTNNVEDYAIAPYNNGQVLRFGLPVSVTNSTHSFIWQSNAVAFQSLNGNYDPVPPATNILKTWVCSTGIPPAGGEQVHINLWLDNGNPPATGQPVEVILSSFDFVPLGPPPPAQLGVPTGLPTGPVQFNLSGQSDWHYQIQASTNLMNWSPIANLLATNAAISFSSLAVTNPFVDANAVFPGPYFYRAKTQP